MRSFLTSYTTKTQHSVAANIGGATRDRTADLLNANQALSQLSYSPKNYAVITKFRQVHQIMTAEHNQHEPSQISSGEARMSDVY